MSFKVLRDAQNAVVAFGPNDDNYDPTIPSGFSLAVEDAQPVMSPPPLTATPFQIRAALTQQNLRSQVESAVASSTNQTMKDAWEYAQVFTENDPFVLQMAATLDQTTTQVHALFQLAQTLQP